MVVKVLHRRLRDDRARTDGLVPLSPVHAWQAMRLPCSIQVVSVEGRSLLFVNGTRAAFRHGHSREEERNAGYSQGLRGKHVIGEQDGVTENGGHGDDSIRLVGEMAISRPAYLHVSLLRVGL